MSATHWYLLGCASGTIFAALVIVFAVVAAWPDLKRGWRG